MFTLIITLLALTPIVSQYQDGSPLYEQHQFLEEKRLNDQVKSQVDLVDKQSPKTLGPPDKIQPATYNGYRVAIPHSEDYAISIIVNPCGANSTNNSGRMALAYDCCMKQYGDGEYGYLAQEVVLQQKPYPEYRRGISDFNIQTGPDEILNNMRLVDEYGNEIPLSTSRRADDNLIIDETCKGLRDPHLSCLDYRLRAGKSDLMTPCTDNNQTVDASLGCFTPDGEKQSNCMQVGYSQSSFIHICEKEFKESNDCGTFLEIHRQEGSFYDAEDVSLSEKKIITRVTDGMITTTISLTYKEDPSRILCDYRETKIRVGSMVLITDQAPTCCCPMKYIRPKKLGSFFCPRKPGTEDGPFADAVDTLEELYERDREQVIYPFCPLMDEDEDILMCSNQSSGGFTQYQHHPNDPYQSSVGRFYTYACNPLVMQEDGTYSSVDLEGKYKDICQIGDVFRACASMPKLGRCTGRDSRFTFIGRIGKVVYVPSDPTQKYGVSFNDGRSKYFFYEHQIELQFPESNYEVLLVQRTRYERIVQKKKKFRVIWPRCTFDSVNDQYFPFALLDRNGNLIEVDAEYDGFIPERKYNSDSLG